jgi:hypothetical protein
MRLEMVIVNRSEMAAMTIRAGKKERRGFKHDFSKHDLSKSIPTPRRYWFAAAARDRGVKPAAAAWAGRRCTTNCIVPRAALTASSRAPDSGEFVISSRRGTGAIN